MNTFPKQMKLCGQEAISALYKEGKRFTSWPLRVTYQEIPNPQSPVTNHQLPITQVLVWAPKSLFKRAVKRNHLRRLMREAFRLNQSLLGEKKVLIAFNYIDKDLQPYQTIEKAVCKALKKINGK